MNPGMTTIKERLIMFLKRIFDEVYSLYKPVAVIGALVLLIWGFHSYVRHFIVESLEKPEMIELITSKVRPVIIFDSENRIISGKNAMKYYVNNIEVIKENGKIKEIAVDTKNLLTNPPILESLDTDFIIPDPVAEKFKWKYDLAEKEVRTIVDEDSPEPRTVLRFRLEFLD